MDNLLNSQAKFDKIRFSKIHPNAKMPVKTAENTGYDLTAVSVRVCDQYIEYDTGLAVEVPQGYTMLIYPRSSISETNLILANSVGVVDPSYRGNIKIRFKSVNSADLSYKVGDRVAQAVFVKVEEPVFIEVSHEELTKTERGAGGFGSTGR